MRSMMEKQTEKEERCVMQENKKKFAKEKKILKNTGQKEKKIIDKEKLYIQMNVG